MANIPRSGVKKTNRARIKSPGSGPAGDARTKRLAERLAAIASNTATNETMQEQEPTIETSPDTHGEARPSLSVPVPQGMGAAKSNNNQHLPLTPPPTPPTNLLDDPSFNDDCMHADESFFFHTLGVATDIRGFDDLGNLILEFDSAACDGLG